MKKSTIFLLTAALLTATSPWALQAASHREAPLVALGHKADITDLFAFVTTTIRPR